MARPESFTNSSTGASTGAPGPLWKSSLDSLPSGKLGPTRSAGPARSAAQVDCVQMECFTSSTPSSISAAPGSASLPSGSLSASAPGGSLNLKFGPGRSPGPCRSAGPARSAESARSPGPSRSCYPPVEAGALLWIPCEKQVWRAGLVLGHNNELVNNSWKKRAIVEVQGDQGKEHKIIDVDAAPSCGRPSYLLRSGELLSMQGAKTVKDLSLLPSLAEPEILHTLRMRYAGQNIYTFAGPMLLAVNPFEEVPGLYDTDQLHKFANLPKGCPCPTPHVFAVARDALLSIQNSSQSQTVLVSGESGAGKTESGKFVIRFLALAGGRKQKAGDLSMEHRVLESVPLLEALGNARTTKNDNSSRFGKYVELQFQQEPSVLGPCIIDAVTHTYLLETVRVTELNEGERCFHIFYQILAAAARAKRMMLAERVANGGSNFLTAIPECSMNTQHVPLTSALPSLMLPDHCEWNPQRFSYLARSSYQWRMPWADEAKQFDATLEAMRAFNMTDDEISQVISAILAVLHLGNIKFQSPPENSEASRVDDSSELGALSLASELLGIGSEDLSLALCTRVLQVHGKTSAQVIRRRRTTSQAADCRDALARHLYGLVFSYIVARINGALSGRGNTTAPLPSIGVLDIFGFEVFEKNCFEQLCINFANEILQQHFNTVIIDHELALYRAEGLECNMHESMLSTAIAQRRIHDSGLCPGIFPMLDDECNIAGGTAESWLNKVSKKYGDSRTISLVPQRKGHFVLHHFAGPVEYCADAFLSKNRDTLSVEAMECMQGSSKTVLRQQFNAHGRTFGTTVSLSGRVLRPKPHSVSSDFQVQLDRLMKNIQATRPHFIRCMKPNQIGAANVFDSFSILQQLRHQGVLEGIRVARAGYGFRLGHEQAVLTYRVLAPRSYRPMVDELFKRGLLEEANQVLVTQMKAAIPEIPSNSIQVGKSMTFFKTEATDVLGIHVRRHREAAALQIQVSWRGHKHARRFAAARKAALSLQKIQRGRRVRSAYHKCRSAALSLQSWRHANSQRSHFQVVIKAVLCLQRFFSKRLSVKKQMSLSFALTEANSTTLMSSNKSCTTAITDGSDYFTHLSTTSSMEKLQGIAVKDLTVSASKVVTEIDASAPASLACSYKLQSPCMLDLNASVDNQLGTSVTSVKTILSNSCCDDEDNCSTSSSRYPTSSLLPCSSNNVARQSSGSSFLHSTTATIPIQDDYEEPLMNKLGEQFSKLERLVHEVREEVQQVRADNLEKEALLAGISHEQERTCLQMKSMDAAVCAAKAQAATQQAILREEQHALQASLQMQLYSMQQNAGIPSRKSVPGETGANSKIRGNSISLGELPQQAKQMMDSLRPPRGTPGGHNLTTSHSSNGSDEYRKPPRSESLAALHSEIANSIEAALSIYSQAPQQQPTSQPEQQTDVARHMASALANLNDDTGGKCLDGIKTEPSTPHGRYRSMRHTAPSTPSTPRGMPRAVRSGTPTTPREVPRAVRTAASLPGTPMSTTRTILLSQADRSVSPRVTTRSQFTPTATPAGGSVRMPITDGSQAVAREVQKAVRAARSIPPSAVDAIPTAMPLSPRQTLPASCSKSQVVFGRPALALSGAASSAGALLLTPQLHHQTPAMAGNASTRVGSASDGKQAGAFVRERWSKEPAGAAPLAVPKIATPSLSAMMVRRSIGGQGPARHAHQAVGGPQPSAVQLTPRRSDGRSDRGSCASTSVAPLLDSCQGA